MEEADGLRIPTVLTAHAKLEVRALSTSFLHGELHQLPDARLVDRREWRRVDDLLLDVPGDDPTFDVVAGEAETALGEIIRAEREEVGVTGDLIGDETGPR